MVTNLSSHRIKKDSPVQILHNSFNCQSSYTVTGSGSNRLEHLPYHPKNKAATLSRLREEEISKPRVFSNNKYATSNTSDSQSLMTSSKSSVSSTHKSVQNIDKSRSLCKRKLGSICLEDLPYHLKNRAATLARLEAEEPNKSANFAVSPNSNTQSFATGFNSTLPISSTQNIKSFCNNSSNSRSSLFGNGSGPIRLEDLPFHPKNKAATLASLENEKLKKPANFAVSSNLNSQSFSTGFNFTLPITSTQISVQNMDSSFYDSFNSRSSFFFGIESGPIRLEDLPYHPPIIHATSARLKEKEHKKANNSTASSNLIGTPIIFGDFSFSNNQYTTPNCSISQSPMTGSNLSLPISQKSVQNMDSSFNDYLNSRSFSPFGTGSGLILLEDLLYHPKNIAATLARLEEEEHKKTNYAASSNLIFSPIIFDDFPFSNNKYTTPNSSISQSPMTGSNLSLPITQELVQNLDGSFNSRSSSLFRSGSDLIPLEDLPYYPQNEAATLAPPEEDRIKAINIASSLDSSSPTSNITFDMSSNNNNHISLISNKSCSIISSNTINMINYTNYIHQLPTFISKISKNTVWCAALRLGKFQKQSFLFWIFIFGSKFIGFDSS